MSSGTITSSAAYCSCSAVRVCADQFDMRSNVQTVGSLFSEMHSVSLVRRSRVCYRPAATPHSLVVESSSTLWANMALVAQLKTQPSLLGQVAAHAAANKGERRVLEKCQVCPRGVFFTTKPKQQGHGLVGLEVAELQELHVARRGDDAGPRVDRQVPLGAECNDTLTLAAPAHKDMHRLHRPVDRLHVHKQREGFTVKGWRHV